MLIRVNVVKLHRNNNEVTNSVCWARKSTSNYTMTLYDGSVTSLERSTLEEDLDILIDCELNFSEHMFAAAKKANGIMGVIRRTFTHLDLNCGSVGKLRSLEVCRLFRFDRLSITNPFSRFPVPRFQLLRPCT